jgi:glycerol-3-phosphate dehydrogenase
MYDFIIIGAGVIGANIARELSRYPYQILVLEKENDIANHQTVANSAIIHSGHDPETELKARLCVWGNALYHELQKDLDIPLLKTGAFVVAHDMDEENKLKELYFRALKNQVPNLEILSGDQARKLEPRLSQSVTKVLSLPTTMVTYPWEVAFACMENAITNGVTFQKNSEVTSIKHHQDYYEITINQNTTVQTKHVITAAGIFADHVAKMVEDEVLFEIQPRKGEYFVLDRKAKGLFSHVLYPLPTKKGKGVLIVPQVHGNILLGPTSVSQDEREIVSTSKDGLNQIKEDLKNLSNQIPYDLVIRSFAGIRATSSYKDFFIQESKSHQGFYHVAGIDSPGLTAAPAIAKYLVDQIIKPKVKQKTDFNPKRIKKPAFFHLNDVDKKRWIENNPKYGNIVCKCEKITEAEIIEAIHGPVGNDTIKGIKKRARAGAGLCQGGYCESMVLKIVARETNTPLNQVNYYAFNTPILLEETKVKK